MSRYTETITALTESGNLRTIPGEGDMRMLDFSTNDYLGLADNLELQRQFLTSITVERPMLSASASRLLASRQNEFAALESLLGELYGRKALLFNSGYHANTGIIPALTGRSTLVLSDRLVHASIIDGILLSRAEHRRFRHNDMEHLGELLAKYASQFSLVMVVVESVYSMDGDCCDVEALLDIKSRYDNVMLYVDEAHAFGVGGPMGLGLVAASSNPAAVDVTVGTFGKAAASAGAFAVMSNEVRTVLVNKARSFIFSTALPPLNAAWTSFVVRRIVEMDAERKQLQDNVRLLHDELRVLFPDDTANPSSHIQRVIIGDAKRAVEVSRKMLDCGVKVLPIRTPTVPAGTERLRISLRATDTAESISTLVKALKSAL